MNKLQDLENVLNSYLDKALENNIKIDIYNPFIELDQPVCILGCVGLYLDLDKESKFKWKNGHLYIDLESYERRASVYDLYEFLGISEHQIRDIDSGIRKDTVYGNFNEYFELGERLRNRYENSRR